MFYVIIQTRRSVDNMNNQYDSILKEKKKYIEVQAPKKKSIFKRCLIIDILLILLLLIISYIIYYNSILSTKNIILNNNKVLLSEYQELFKYLYLDEILSDGTLDGELTLNDNNYNFKTSKDQDKLFINLENDKEIINYYYAKDSVYFQIPSISDNYIKTNMLD